jgi:hypothetical protein
MSFSTFYAPSWDHPRLKSGVMLKSWIELYMHISLILADIFDAPRTEVLGLV